MLTDIALDAVGTDKAPEPEIRGAILACRALPVRVHLIGPEPELRDLLDEYLQDEDLPIVIHHASERIGMEEKAASSGAKGLKALNWIWTGRAASSKRRLATG